MRNPEILGRGEFFGLPVATRRLGPFSLIVTRYEERMSIPWHAHDEPYLTFVARGSYRERVRSETRVCRPRIAILHAAGECHADEFASAATCLNVHIDAQWALSTSARGVRVDRATIVDSPAVGAIGARLAREIRSTDDLSPMVVEGLMLEMFAEAERHPSDHRTPSWLRDVRAMVSARFRESLTLAELAAESGIHPVHMARSFRRHYGCTIGELIRDLKVERAKSCIRSGATLNDTSEDAGFTDQSHMTRVFRAAVGLTPGQFRRQCGQAASGRGPCANRVPRR